jgi:3-oxoadipate enol-lactonase
VLIHGLTTTRDAVLMGSRDLERNGFRVIAYDMRSHGHSEVPADGDYSYDALVGDLVRVMDAFGAGRAVLVGNSVGAHTALRFALERPDRVAGLAAIAPAFDPERVDHESLREAGELAVALREGRIEGFTEAVRFPEGMPAAFGRALLRRRLKAHENLDGLADALEAHPGPRPFDAIAQLAAIQVPTLVVGTQDAMDPRHPLAVAVAYAEALPDSRFFCEEPGQPPLAWSARRIAPLVLDLAQRAAWERERAWA